MASRLFRGKVEGFKPAAPAGDLLWKAELDGVWISLMEEALEEADVARFSGWSWSGWNGWEADVVAAAVARGANPGWPEL